MRFLIILAAAVVVVTAPVEAANRNAVVRTRTLQPLVLTNTRPLDFGTMIIGTTAGTAVVNATTDARTRSGGVTLIGGGAPGAARFTLRGTPAINAVITIGPLPTLTHVAGPETLRVTALRLNGAATRRIPASGSLDVRIGGTLAVAARQRDGLYTGSFAVTVNYQ